MLVLEPKARDNGTSRDSIRAPRNRCGFQGGFSVRREYPGVDSQGAANRVVTSTTKAFASDTCVGRDPGPTSIVGRTE